MTKVTSVSANTPQGDAVSITIVLTRRDLAAAGFRSDVDAETLALVRDVLEDKLQEEHFRAALVSACEELDLARPDKGDVS